VLATPENVVPAFYVVNVSHSGEPPIFPETRSGYNARWNADRQAVEFSVTIR